MSKLYLYKLDEDYSININGLPDLDSEYVACHDGILKVREGYAWDGCSPKRGIFSWFVIGTPDGIVDYRTGKPATYYASLIHDAMYQYNLGEREVADNTFYALMHSVGFKPAQLYYRMVRLFGGISWRLNGRKLK